MSVGLVSFVPIPTALNLIIIWATSKFDRSKLSRIQFVTHFFPCADEYFADIELSSRCCSFAYFLRSWNNPETVTFHFQAAVQDLSAILLSYWLRYLNHKQRHRQSTNLEDELYFC